MNPEMYNYLRPLIAAEGGNREYLIQVFTLAKNGIEEHVATIATLCGAEGDNPDTTVELQEIAVAVHRLTNVITALRLEEPARRLNSVEGAARSGVADTTCREYAGIEPVLRQIQEEIDRGLAELSEG
ncbi:MAG: hypothetical protein ACOCYQ_08970 [Alkalispirochaeta sp.]